MGDFVYLLFLYQQFFEFNMGIVYRRHSNTVSYSPSPRLAVVFVQTLSDTDLIDDV